MAGYGVAEALLGKALVLAWRVGGGERGGEGKAGDEEKEVT